MAVASPNRWAGQAAQDAMLKFAPQQTSLAEALQQAKEAYGQTVTAGNSTATLTGRAAQAALPKIQQVYGKANAAQGAGVTLVNQQLANLPGVANQFKADQASEVQQQLSNLLGSKARDEAMLTNAGTAAREGAQFNQTNARATLQKTLQGLLSRSTATAQEQGAFASTEAEKLAHEAEKLEQSETASKRTAQTSENNSIRSTAGAERRSERSAASKTGAGGVKPLSTAQNNSGASLISQIRHYAGELGASGGTTRAELVQLLSEGQPQSSHARVQTINGKSVTEHIPIPKIPAFKPDVLMSAALDEALGGHLSKNTEDRLTQAGYSIKTLGLKPSRGNAEKPTIKSQVNTPAEAVKAALGF